MAERELTMSDRGYNNKQMGDACEMLVAAKLTLHGVPAIKVPDNWPDYDVVAHLGDQLQRISVKSRSVGNLHYIGFNPETCDWLAIALIFDDGTRQFFIIPQDIAKTNAFRPSFIVPKAATHRVYVRAIFKALSAYKDNFTLCRDPAAQANGGLSDI